MKGRIQLILAVVILLLVPVMALGSLEEIQKAIEESGADWIAGENEISRLDPEVFRGMLGLRPDLVLEDLPEFEAYVPPFDRDLPTAFSWKDVDGVNYMTGVRNQYNCGACWDFSIVGSLEGIIQVVENKPFEDTDLSEQFILSCSSGGCNGSTPGVALMYILEHGIPDEDCFPYVANDNIPCSDVCDDWEERAYYIDDVMTVSQSIIDLKNAVYDYGPISVNMSVYDDFVVYNGGVYIHSWGQYQGGHCVVLCGWDNAECCWVAKNSWGTGWGEGGYFRIRWGDCNFGSGAMFPIYSHSEKWPHLTDASYTPVPLAGSNTVTATATFDNTPYGGVDIDFVEVFVDEVGGDYTGFPATPVDGQFDSPIEEVTVSIPDLGFTLNSAHLLYWHALGSDMTWSVPERCSYVLFNCMADGYAESEMGDTELSSIDIRSAAFFAFDDSLRIWLDYDRSGRSTMEIGIAIDANSPDVGTNDAVGRRIRWSEMTTLPDYMAYKRIDNDFQQIRYWNGSNWSILHSGFGVLGWLEDHSLHVLSLPLSDIGSPSEGDILNFEIWTCRAVSSSGALDLLASDSAQESDPAGTNWDLESGDYSYPDTWFSYVVNYDMTAIVTPTPSGEARLLGAWPNPFNPATLIAFELPQAGLVNLTVYTPAGRRVSDLFQGRCEAGRHEIEWDGRGSSGKPLASGVYLARLQVDGRDTGLLKMSLTK